MLPSSFMENTTANFNKKKQKKYQVLIFDPFHLIENFQYTAANSAEYWKLLK